MESVAIKFLVDEQINPRVARALRDKGVEAVSVHEIGLANQGYHDEPLLELAVSREETLLSLGGDFLAIHSRWQAEDRTHCGIFQGETKNTNTLEQSGISFDFAYFGQSELVTMTKSLKKQCIMRFSTFRSLR